MSVGARRKVRSDPEGRPSDPPRSAHIVGWNRENLLLGRREAGGAFRVQRLRIGDSVERFTKQLDLPLFGHKQPGKREMDGRPVLAALVWTIYSAKTWLGVSISTLVSSGLTLKSGYSVPPP